MSTRTASLDALAPLTVDDYDHYEVVDGQRVQLSPMWPYQSVVASRLLFTLGIYCRSNRIGRSIGYCLFSLSVEPTLQRRPVFAVVSYERWPANRGVPDVEAWPVIPDLAVEIIRPGNTVNEIASKLDDYFTCGVKQVWVVYTEPKWIHVYHSLDDIRVYRNADVLEGGPILPGFRLPLAEFFAQGC